MAWTESSMSVTNTAAVGGEPSGPTRRGITDIGGFLASFGELNAGNDAYQDKASGPAEDSGASLLADPPVPVPTPTPQPVIPVPVLPDPVDPAAPGPVVLVPEPVPPPAPPLSTIQPDASAQGLPQASTGATGQVSGADGGSALAGGEQAGIKPQPGTGSESGFWSSSSTTTTGPTGFGLHGSGLEFGSESTGSVLGAAAGLGLRTISDGDFGFSFGAGGGSAHHRRDQPDAHIDARGPAIPPLPPAITSAPAPPDSKGAPVVDHAPALPPLPPGQPTGPGDAIAPVPADVRDAHMLIAVSQAVIGHWEAILGNAQTDFDAAQNAFNEMQANITAGRNAIDGLEDELNHGQPNNDLATADLAGIAAHLANIANWQTLRNDARTDMEEAQGVVQWAEELLDRQHDIMEQAQAIVDAWANAGYPPAPNPGAARQPGSAAGHELRSDSASDDAFDHEAIGAAIDDLLAHQQPSRSDEPDELTNADARIAQADDAITQLEAIIARVNADIVAQQTSLREAQAHRAQAGASIAHHEGAIASGSLDEAQAGPALRAAQGELEAAQDAIGEALALIAQNRALIATARTAIRDAQAIIDGAAAEILAAMTDGHDGGADDYSGTGPGQHPGDDADAEGGSASHTTTTSGAITFNVVAHPLASQSPWMCVEMSPAATPSGASVHLRDADAAPPDLSLLRAVVDAWSLSTSSQDHAPAEADDAGAELVFIGTPSDPSLNPAV